MNKEKLTEYKIWKVTVHNEDSSVLMYVAESKLEAIVKYYEHVKMLNDPEYINVNDDFHVDYVGYAYE